MTRIVVAAVIIDPSTSTLLLAQRSSPPEDAGLWELPGGKVEDGETWQAALEREIVEELGMRVEAGEQVGEVVTGIPGFEVVALRARQTGGTPRALEHADLRWVDVAELRRMNEAGVLMASSVAWLDELIGLLSNWADG
ncbi:(deoxy)nucleoside triphosphate pyrophosphohydrolase [Gordonia sp. (in: high G+C Gram-positive bacteria)]|jgi:8-oxo-dGTP diphosphatase|uniref:(deoxy)nucleoside triphosphate pyrophosphohydrolase n=1 Tax=Gordonia sp. (in: high G+C Gram-positive bacteria) TaxID=84139 RepID=UPI001DA62D91|nr:NUDIX domain-containing protein [Gordonia sp. (in: high G+C Gram-positive bacteria)]MCB1293822.1 NUDIX domain-containing protein [Gordonia sp. (in: high G+C Gram-positive bacteria)]HMS73613.1 NUDIX domain-containing protein [Gordonia sp. (in: high G+C Gram-positive bacteria)]HQV18696.1 NUDIX domain-containing protein [Gordonia sp. (in: high G+C Gram-positive bacteria)]